MSNDEILEFNGGCYHTARLMVKILRVTGMALC